MKLIQSVIIAFFLANLLVSCTEIVPFDEFRRTGGNRYIELPAGTTNYELSGDPIGSHVVVLIHGGTIPLCIWEPQLEALRSAGFKILQYDQYGRGFSSRLKRPYSPDLYREQLLELLDSLHLTAPVSLVGPSFGGAIAVSFAAAHPGRIRSMVLASPVLNLMNSSSPLVKPMTLMAKPVLGEIAYSLLLRRKIISRGRALVPGGRKSSCDSSFVRQFTCKGTGKALLSQIRSRSYGNYREATRKVAADSLPVLLLRGKNDTEVTEAMIREVREDLPVCTFVEMENCGHGASVENPEAFNRLMIDFLQQH